jgi:acyl carrier protein
MIEHADFLLQMDELLDQQARTLTGSEPLNAIERWDSVALVTFLAMVDERYERNVQAAAVSKCKTIDDLYRLVSQSPSN